MQIIKGFTAFSLPMLTVDGTFLVLSLLRFWLPSYGVELLSVRSQGQTVCNGMRTPKMTSSPSAFLG